MRKVTFYIDDTQYYHNLYDITDEQHRKTFKDITTFKAIYALYGDTKTAVRFTLTDYDGKKLDINKLNAYITGIILNDCLNYFSTENSNPDKYPCGVVKIEETEK